MGGTVKAPGNVTPAAEFNIYCDPQAAREVFARGSTKTLVPLDVTNQVIMTYGHLERLPSEETNAGRFLRQILPHAFRTPSPVAGARRIHDP